MRNRVWTWIGGSKNANQPGNYGSRGVAAVSNVPGARYYHSMVIDSAGRTFYLFGGHSGSGTLNDLWMFNLNTGMWTWISGDSTINQAGNYGTRSVAAPQNKPGARHGHSMSFDSLSGVLFVMGGLETSLSREYPRTSLFRLSFSYKQVILMTFGDIISSTACGHG